MIDKKRVLKEMIPSLIALGISIILATLSLLRYLKVI